jgi:hypothetical protein
MKKGKNSPKPDAHWTILTSNLCMFGKAKINVIIVAGKWKFSTIKINNNKIMKENKAVLGLVAGAVLVFVILWTTLKFNPSILNWMLGNEIVGKADENSTIDIIGFFIGVFSLVWAFYERNRNISIEEKRRSQLWSCLDRARYVIGDHILLSEFDKELKHPEKHRLWNIHQAASDLYISLVEQYLSIVDKFTYEDLKRLCDNEFIVWRWQEKQWRLIISQRKENRSTDPPPYFTKENSRPFGKIANADKV